MELGLSLGENSRPTTFSSFLNKSHKMNTHNIDKSLGFCMSLSLTGFASTTQDRQVSNDGEDDSVYREEKRVSSDSSLQQPLQLDLLPLAPVPRNTWLSENDSAMRGFDVNRFPLTEEADDGAAVSSPNSTVSSFQIDFSNYRGKRDSETAGLNEVDADRDRERGSSRASDDDENGSGRKKLRLSKDQSAFLEESFKEHNTLNPKQKLALAKQLNLRPRQVEVWFQNRRARTKLKQTEVDCEYLKRCCDTLTEENRRLQKEIQELRALKTSHPYYMQLPATTLTMCPSCERVATTSTTTTAQATTITTASTSSSVANCTTPNPTKPRFYPFSHPHPNQSAALS